MTDPITPLPPPPNRGMQDREAFVIITDNFLASLPNFVSEVNAFAAAENSRINAAFTGESTDSITIGTGSKVLAASTGMALVPGHTILISATAAPENQMAATVIDYDSETGQLEVDVSGFEGSGTFSSWSIGLAVTSPPPDLSDYLKKSGGTTTGLIVADGGLAIRSGAPSMPQNGEMWYAGSTFVVRMSGASYAIATASTAQNLSNKTLVDPTLQGTPTTDIFTITDGSSVTIDPADGEVQLWTLGANRTPTLTSITAGKAVVLMINDGSAYTLTLTGVTWLTDDGDPPTLKATGYTSILLFNIGGTLYGWRCGDGG